MLVSRRNEANEAQARKRLEPWGSARSVPNSKVVSGAVVENLFARLHPFKHLPKRFYNNVTQAPDCY